MKNQVNHIWYHFLLFLRLDPQISITEINFYQGKSLKGYILERAKTMYILLNAHGEQSTKKHGKNIIPANFYIHHKVK